MSGSRSDRCRLARFAWERLVREDPRITGTTQGALLVMATFTDHDGAAQLDETRLARCCGVSERTARRAVADGRAAGYLRRLTRGHDVVGDDPIASSHQLVVPIARPLTARRDSNCPSAVHRRGHVNDQADEHVYRSCSEALYGRVVWVEDSEPSPLLPPCEVPNQPSGWADRWPIPPLGHRPSRGVPVVYRLYKSSGEPVVYIGSTASFSTRMARHESAGRRWAWWSAEACADRATAYARETALIDLLQPRDNIVGRRR